MCVRMHACLHVSVVVAFPCACAKTCRKAKTNHAPHTGLGNNQQHPTQSIVLGMEGLVREKGGERWERTYVQKQTLPPAKWSRKHLQEGSGLWGFRGWLVRECFVCRVGVGGFHILPHCHIWGSHLCWADGSLSSPVLMARGAARSGPVMAIPGCPGEGCGAACLLFSHPRPSTTSQSSLPG